LQVDGFRVRIRSVPPGLGSPHECLSASEHPPAPGSSWRAVRQCFGPGQRSLDTAAHSCPMLPPPLFRRRRSGGASWCCNSPPTREMRNLSIHPWKLGRQLLSSSPLTATGCKRMPRPAASDLVRAWATEAEAQVERTSALRTVSAFCCSLGARSLSWRIAGRTPHEEKKHVMREPTSRSPGIGPRLYQADHTMGGILTDGLGMS